LVKEVIESHFKQIPYGNYGMRVHKPATDDDLAAAWDTLLHGKIDPNINKESPCIVDFLEKHSQSDCYHIEIYKCGHASCICGNARMPSDTWKQISS